MLIIVRYLSLKDNINIDMELWFNEFVLSSIGNGEWCGVGLCAIIISFLRTISDCTHIAYIKHLTHWQVRIGYNKSTRLPWSMPNANQCRSKSCHWSETPINDDHCQSISIKSFWLIWHWLELIGIRINARILIGIDWHWSALGIDRGSPEVYRHIKHTMHSKNRSFNEYYFLPM